jgi:hypothetical protein
MPINPHEIRRDRQTTYASPRSVVMQLDPTNDDEARILDMFNEMKNLGAQLICIPPCEQNHTTYLIFDMAYTKNGQCFSLKGGSAYNAEMCIEKQYNRLMDAARNNATIIVNPDDKKVRKEYKYDQEHNHFRQVKKLGSTRSN